MSLFLFDDAKVDIFFNSAIVGLSFFEEKVCFLSKCQENGRIPLKGVKSSCDFIVFHCRYCLFILPLPSVIEQNSIEHY